MMTSRRYFLLVLLIYLALATGYSLVEPLGEAPDEADHYAYIRYLGLHRQLPEGPRITQGKHPPLYHAAAALLTSWTGLDADFLLANPDALPPGPDSPPNFFIHTTREAFPWQGGVLAMRLARFLSIALGAVTLWATWRMGREAFPEHPEIGLFAALFLAGLPGFLFISGSVNNDNAAGAFGALAILLCLQVIWRGAALARVALLGLVLGLGALSKVGTLALWPLVPLAMIGAYWPQRRRWRGWLKTAGFSALAWAIGLLVASPWLIRNQRLYGDPLGWALVRATIDERTEPLTPRVFAWLFKGLYQYFWGRFGAIGQIMMPSWFYVLAGVLLLLLCAGALYYLWKLLPRRHRSLFSVILLILAVVLVIASIVRYTAIALGTDQARLMWPAISAIAVLAGAGIAGFSSAVGLTKRFECKKLFVGLLLGWTMVALSTLIFAIVPAFAPPPPFDPTLLSGDPPLATFGEHLTLVQADLPQDPLAAGEPVPMQLVWRAEAPLADDLRPVVRLYHQDGWLAAEKDHSPAQGRYSTDRWQPGELVADSILLIPNPESNGTFTVQVAVRPYRGDWLPPSDSETPFVTLGVTTYR